MFLFSRKKKKGLKGFMVLVGTADSLAEHTLYEVKYGIWLTQNHLWVLLNIR
ncbi:hypothetical protein L3D_26890 [Enterococcus faecalis]|nr:hypothetical protein L3D_26890 [Enterococcus faecalis]